MRQSSLFAPGAAAVRMTPAVQAPVERRRLSRQCDAILDRLRDGPATNVELAGFALKYTSRISDLRRAGFAIDCERRDAVTGLTWYRLRDAAR